MNRRRLLQAIMAWALVLVMVLTSSGDIMVSRAENGQTNEQTNEKSGQDTSEESGQDTSEESNQETSEEPVQPKWEDAVGTIEITSEEKVSGLGKVDTGISIQVLNAEALKSLARTVKITIGNYTYTYDITGLGTQVNPQYITVDFVNDCGVKENIKAGTAVYINFCDEQGDSQNEQSVTTSTGIYFSNSIDSVSASRSAADKCTVKVETSFLGSRSYTAKAIDSVTGAEIVSKEATTSDESCSVDITDSKLMSSNYYVEVSGTDCWGNSLATVKSGTITNTSTVTIDCPDNVTVSAAGGSAVSGEENKYTLTYGNTLNLTFKAVLTDASKEVVINEITDNGAGKLSDLEYSKANDAVVYTQTSVTVPFDGNNHTVNIKTRAINESDYTAKLTYKADTFYPTYTYSLNFEFKSRFGNIFKDNSEEYTVKSGDVKIDADTKTFTVNEEAEKNSIFKIVATYEVEGIDEDLTVAASGKVSYADLDNFKYTYVDEDGDELATTKDNTSVWVNKEVYLKLDFSHTDITMYKVNNGEFTKVSDESQRKVYSDSENALFTKQEEVTVKTKARGDNSGTDVSGDNNNFKYNETKIDVRVDLNAPELGDGSVTAVLYKKDGTKLKSYDDVKSGDTLGQAYRKSIKITPADSESGLVDKAIYSTKALDITDIDTEKVNKLLADHKDSLLEAKDGSFTLELNAEDNKSEKEKNKYYFYVFDNAGNCTEFVCDMGAVTDVSVADPVYKTAPVQSDGVNYVTAGNSVTITAKGSFADYGTDLNADYGDGTPGIKFYYIKDNGKKVQVKNLSAKQDDVYGYTVTGTFEITANLGDGEYTLYMEAYDATGGKGTVQATFVVDNIYPEITGNTSFGTNSFAYLAKSPKWDLKTVDNNLVSIEPVSVKVENLASASVTETALSDQLKNAFTYPADKSKFSKNGVTYSTGSYAASAEAKYTVKLKATDIVGHVTYYTAKFCYDKTKPDISNFKVTPINGSYSDYKSFSRSAVNVSFNANDDVSGLKQIKVEYISANYIGEHDPVIYNKKEGTLTSSCSVKVDWNFKGKVKITVYDQVGNVYTSSYDAEKYFGLVREDKTSHNESSSVLVTANTAISNNYNDVEYYGKGEDIILTLISEDTMSGIKKVTLSDNGTNKVYDYSSEDKIATKKTEKYTIKSESSTEGMHKIKAVLVDNAGNTISSGTVQKYVVDITKPVIDFSYSTTNKSGFYNDARTVNITITETNFDSDYTVVKMTKNNGKPVVLDNKFKLKNGKYTMSYVCADDAEYVFEVSTEDKAGNKAETRKSDKFTIDRTNPIMNVTYDNNSAQNGNFYSASRTATISIDEHNFDASRVNVSVTANGSDSGTPGVSDFSGSGDTHTATVQFASDGEYTINVSMTDSAGNQAENTFEDTFTVDMTAPEINITGVDDGSVNTDVVAPTISVTDTNYSVDDVSVSVTGSRGNAGSSDIQYSTQNIQNGVSYVYSDFADNESVDDYYTLTVTAKDKAGNESSREIKFKVDRFGSYFTLDTTTKASVSSYYTNLSDGDIVIEEYNVAGFGNSNIYYTLNDKVVNLSESDYTVKEQKPVNGWNRRTYTIPASIFSEEGVYRVVIHSKDSADRETDNEVKGTDVTFCIDRTAPEYYISGVEDGGLYENTDAVNAVVSFHDNIALGYAEITLDGETSRYEAKDIEKLGGEVTLEGIKASSKQHTLSVVCYDAAGNKSANSGNEISFTVSNSAVQTAMAKASGSMWILILILILLLAAIVLIIVIVRRKKKKEE